MTKNISNIISTIESEIKKELEGDILCNYKNILFSINEILEKCETDNEKIKTLLVIKKNINGLKLDELMGQLFGIKNNNFSIICKSTGYVERNLEKRTLKIIDEINFKIFKENSLSFFQKIKHYLLKIIIWKK